MWEQFTERARRVVFHAQEEAARLGESSVRTEHMLLALIRDQESHGYKALEHAGVTADHIWQHMGSKLRYGSGKLGETMQLSPKSKRVIDVAFNESQTLKSGHIGTGHLLLGLISEEGLAGRTLSELGLSIDQLRESVHDVTHKVVDLPKSQPSRVGPQGQLQLLQLEEQAKMLSENIQLVLSGMGSIKSQLAPDNELISESLRGRSLLSIRDLSSSEISQIFAATHWLKRSGDFAPQFLRGKVLAMIFEKPSLRTRVSFEVGMFKLGGHAVYMQPDDIQLGKRETVPDAARCLGRMSQGIMARVFSHTTVEQLAKYAGVPVINALCDVEHPCQALADFFTIKEKKLSLRGLKIAYVGDGNNVCHSLMLTAAKVGAHMWVAAPQGYQPKEEFVKAAREDGKATNSEIHITEDPFEAARDADVIYTDTWISMGEEDEAEVRKKVFPPYQINARLVSAAKPDAIVMHCLPAYRGSEITDEVIDSPQSVVFDEAENRMHVQKAIMAMTM